jgi:hypothetical protein
MALALLVGTAMAVSLQAQTPAPAEGPTAPDASNARSADSQGTPASPAAPVDVSKLGVSMSRIKQGLRVTESSQTASSMPLKIEYQVQVFGAAPRIDILRDFNIGQGAPVSYGAPTHNDFVTQWTPQAYRSPPASLSSLAGWALFQMAKQSEKSKCEEEIANYRQLIMQGVPMAAPRCTQ